MAYLPIFSIVRRKQPSPEHIPRREPVARHEALTNGNHGPSHAAQYQSFGMPSPESPYSDDGEDLKTDTLGRRCVVFVASKSLQMPSS